MQTHAFPPTKSPPERFFMALASISCYNLGNSVTDFWLSGVMPDNSRRFFLQAIDKDHGCAVLEASFYVEDVGELRKLVDAGEADGRDWDVYDIDRGELGMVCQRYGVVFDPGDREVRITRWHSIRAAPYLIHTNYELMLLLDGTKKFARELEVYPPGQHHNEELFDRYVSEGLLHKHVSLEPFKKPTKLGDGRVYEGSREVCYTLKGEEWRVDAWKLISAASKKSGWNETFERLEGMLFGYSEWQMDWWMEQWRARRDASKTQNETGVDAEI